MCEGFLTVKKGRAMTQAVSRRPLTAEATGSILGQVHVGFVVDKMALGQVFYEYFGFPVSVLFHRCSITRKNEKTTHLHRRVAQ